MMRKCHDPEHLDAHIDADWSGDSINRKSTSGGILKIGTATLESSQKVTREREYYAAVTTTAEAMVFQRLLEFLGNAGQCTVANRLNGRILDRRVITLVSQIFSSRQFWVARW